MWVAEYSVFTGGGSSPTYHSQTLTLCKNQLWSDTLPAERVCGTITLILSMLLLSDTGQGGVRNLDVKDL